MRRSGWRTQTRVRRLAFGHEDLDLTPRRRAGNWPQIASLDGLEQSVGLMDAGGLDRVALVALGVQELTVAQIAMMSNSVGLVLLLLTPDSGAARGQRPAPLALKVLALLARESDLH
jgi:hypothetical protein